MKSFDYTLAEQRMKAWVTVTPAFPREVQKYENYNLYNVQVTNLASAIAEDKANKIKLFGLKKKEVNNVSLST